MEQDPEYGAHACLKLPGRVEEAGRVCGLQIAMFVRGYIGRSDLHGVPGPRDKYCHGEEEKDSGSSLFRPGT